MKADSGRAASVPRGDCFSWRGCASSYIRVVCPLRLDGVRSGCSLPRRSRMRVLKVTMAVPVLESIDALLTDDARTLDDDELKDRVRALVRGRAQVDGALLAAVRELEQRSAYVAD